MTLLWRGFAAPQKGHNFTAKSLAFAEVVSQSIAISSFLE